MKKLLFILAVLFIFNISFFAANISNFGKYYMSTVDIMLQQNPSDSDLVATKFIFDIYNFNYFDFTLLKDIKTQYSEVSGFFEENNALFDEKVFDKKYGKLIMYMKDNYDFSNLKKYNSEFQKISFLFPINVQLKNKALHDFNNKFGNIFPDRNEVCFNTDFFYFMKKLSE